jgi:hypothetical protein
VAVKPGFFDYVTAAFNARPLGMFLPPNWVGLAAFGLLGVANPGFWVLGAGLELAYLLSLSTNPRFQRLVAARPTLAADAEWNQRVQRALAQLDPSDRRMYLSLVERCRSILTLQSHGAEDVTHGLEAQADSLGRLSWMFLRLLVARRTIRTVIGAGDADGDDLQRRLVALQRDAQREDVEDELRRSLTGQIEILQQRVQQRAEAQRKLAYIDAELARIQQQVELIREQAALSTDPELLSRRIDEITGTLGATGQWIREQQQVYGAMEDLLTEPPPLSVDARARESQ